jgi:hypothetical protein
MLYAAAPTGVATSLHTFSASLVTGVLEQLRAWFIRMEAPMPPRPGWSMRWTQSDRTVFVGHAGSYRAWVRQSAADAAA